MQVTRLKIHGRCDTLGAGSRSKRPLIPLEKEGYVNIENLESALIAQIEEFHRAIPEKQLVLVLDSAGKQFERVSLEFPGICQLFSEWIDPSTLPLTESLDLVGLPSDPQHEASDLAVFNLAVLYDLTYPRRLIIKLRDMSLKAEVAAQVAHFASREHRALIYMEATGNEKEGCRYLPDSMATADSLLAAFHHFNPIGAAADRGNFKDGQAGYSSPESTDTQNTIACVVFRNSVDLQAFIEATDGQRYGHLVVKVEKATAVKETGSTHSTAENEGACRKETAPVIHAQAQVFPPGNELPTPSDSNISTRMATGMNTSAQVWEQQREATVHSTEVRGSSSVYNPPLPPSPSTEEEKSGEVSKQSTSKDKTQCAIGTGTSGKIGSEPARDESSLADYIYRNWTLWRLPFPGGAGKIEMHACLNDGLLLKLPAPPHLQPIIDKRENELRRQGASHALAPQPGAHQQPRSTHSEQYNSDRNESGACRVCDKHHTPLKWRQLSGEWDVDRNEDGSCGLCDVFHSDDEWRELTNGVVDPSRDEVSIQETPPAMITPSRREEDLSSPRREEDAVDENTQPAKKRRVARFFLKLMKDNKRKDEG